MEEQMSHCSNCEKPIAASNFVIHSLHCQRNIVKCEKCGDAVPRSSLADHHSEFHSVIPCPDCKLQLEKTKLEKHKKDSCCNRQQTCQFCDLSMTAKQLQDHENYCGSRTQRCDGCGEYVLLKYQQVHLDSNHTFLNESGMHGTWIKNDIKAEQSNPKSNNNVKKYNFDSDENDVDDLDHLFAGLIKKDRNNKQPTTHYPGVAYPVSSFSSASSHANSYAESDRDALVTLPCEFCDALIPSDQLLLHQTGCRPDISSFRRSPPPSKNVTKKVVNKQAEDLDFIDLDSASFVDVEGSSSSEDEKRGFNKQNEAKFSSKQLEAKYNHIGLAGNHLKNSRQSSSSSAGNEAQSTEVVDLPCEFCGDGYPPGLLLQHQDVCNFKPENYDTLRYDERFGRDKKKNNLERIFQPNILNQDDFADFYQDKAGGMRDNVFVDSESSVNEPLCPTPNSHFDTSMNSSFLRYSSSSQPQPLLLRNQTLDWPSAAEDQAVNEASSISYHLDLPKRKIVHGQGSAKQSFNANAFRPLTGNKQHPTWHFHPRTRNFTDACTARRPCTGPASTSSGLSGLPHDDNDKFGIHPPHSGGNPSKPVCLKRYSESETYPSQEHGSIFRDVDVDSKHSSHRPIIICPRSLLQPSRKPYSCFKDLARKFENQTAVHRKQLLHSENYLQPSEKNYRTGFKAVNLDSIYHTPKTCANFFQDTYEAGMKACPKNPALDQHDSIPANVKVDAGLQPLPGLHRQIPRCNPLFQLERMAFAPPRQSYCYRDSNMKDPQPCFHDSYHQYRSIKRNVPSNRNNRASGAQGSLMRNNNSSNAAPGSKNGDRHDLSTRVPPTAASGAIPKPKAGKLSNMRQIEKETSRSRSTRNDVMVDNRSQEASLIGNQQSSSYPQPHIHNHLHNYDKS